MAFCSKCGKPIGAQAQFCGHCGAPRIVRGSGGQKFNGPRTVKMQGARVAIDFPGQPPKEYPLSGVTGIGREADNQIVVPLNTVSRHHAQIIPDKSGFAIVDLGSSNGTYLQGSRIPAQTPVSIPDGGIIRIGDQLGNSFTLTVQLGSAVLGGYSQTITLNKASLMSKSRIVIGRDPQSDVSLNSPLVSWHHAEIIRTATGHEIRDTGSTNGTFINGKKINHQLLQYNDQIQIGSYKLCYDTGGLSAAPNIGSVRLDCVNLTKTVPIKPKGIAWGENGKYAASQPSTKAILNNVNLTVMPREFVALVGGSGAGKSTLMDALNGFRRVPTGKVMVNGDDLYQNYDMYRADMGYVPQYDILHTDLTVQRALRYTAMLRLPPDTKPEEIDRRVEQALNDVQMEKQIDQKISSLSGGQRKRVSIASELLSDPSLFFLDEPTSGLDPGLDKRMMTTLNQLSDSGRTIILTTHATNNINNNCNLVAFMAFGRLVYYGPPADALSFFGVNDFSDIYNLFKDTQDADTCEKRFRASPFYRQYVGNRQANLVTSGGKQANVQRKLASLNLKAELRQFGILVMRYLNLIFSNYMQMFILLAVMPIIGLLLLLIANPMAFVGDSQAEIDQILLDQGHYNIAVDAQKLMLMLALSAVLLGVFASAYEIVREINIYRRERMVNLHIVPYLTSKVAVLLGFGVFQCLALLLVVRSKVEISAAGLFFPAGVEIFVTLLVALFVGISIGLLISAGVKTDGVVIYLILIILFLQIIFSGAIFELPDAAKPISVVTPARWVMEALGSTINIEELNELTANHIDKVKMNGKEVDVNSTSKMPMEFNINYERTQGHLLMTWFILLVYAAVCLALAGWLLKRQDVG